MTSHTVNFTVVGSRPSDHYFRSVCLSVCLFVCLFVRAEFFMGRGGLRFSLSSIVSSYDVINDVIMT